MKPRYQYILFVLLLLIVYEVYLIVFYKYQDFQINSYITSVTSENTKIEQSIAEKKEYFAYVQTNAYANYIAKSSQNKKDEGEDVVFLVTPNDVEEYKKLDTDKQIIGGADTRTARSKTYGMNNQEKWVYYIFHIDVRD